jgi:hypothetical protein
MSILCIKHNPYPPPKKKNMHSRYSRQRGQAPPHTPTHTTNLLIAMMRGPSSWSFPGRQRAPIPLPRGGWTPSPGGALPRRGGPSPGGALPRRGGPAVTPARRRSPRWHSVGRTPVRRGHTVGGGSPVTRGGATPWGGPCAWRGSPVRWWPTPRWRSTCFFLGGGWFASQMRQSFGSGDRV